MASKATTTANTEDPDVKASPTAVGDESGATVKPVEPQAKPVKQQGKAGVYYIVNPAGAVHSVERDHAAWRLRTAGWRMATEEEIAAYRGQEIQRHDRPIAPKWAPDPDKQIAELE